MAVTAGGHCIENGRVYNGPVGIGFDGVKGIGLVNGLKKRVCCL